MNKAWIITPVVLIILYITNTIYQSNLLKNYQEFHIENCLAVAEIFGPEDIEKINNENLIISSYIHKGDREGSLYSYNIKSNQLSLLTGNLKFPFYPHGISTFDSKIIYAINHHPEGDRIEKFKWVDSKIVFEKSLQDPQLQLANDLAPINSDQFFVTIDHGFKNTYGQLFENYSRVGFGHVLFFDGVKFLRVIDQLSYANGVVADNINKKLYVAEMLAKKIHIYNIENPIKPVKLSEIKTEGFPDNLSLDLTTQQLWIATHLKILSLKKHSNNHEVEISPSGILKVDLQNNNVKQMLLGNSLKFSALSIATPANEHYYLGSIFGSTIFKCSLQ